MSQGKDPNDQPSTSAQESSSDQQEQKSVASMASLLDRLRLARAQKKEAKDKYAFWETQPVMQFSEDAASNSVSGQHRHGMQAYTAAPLSNCSCSLLQPTQRARNNSYTIVCLHLFSSSLASEITVSAVHACRSMPVARPGCLQGQGVSTQPSMQ